MRLPHFGKGSPEERATLFGEHLNLAKQAAADDLGDVAGLVADLEEPVEGRGDDKLSERFRAAIELYADAEAKLGGSASEFALADAVRTIAAAQRELLMIAAVLDESPHPKLDEPPCLLDPSHGPAARVVVWAPPGGDPRAVPVCAADGETIAAGGEAEPRRFPHGHQLRPYWEFPELACWFLGYFDDYTGYDVVALSAGTPLGAELATRALTLRRR